MKRLVVLLCCLFAVSCTAAAVDVTASQTEQFGMQGLEDALDEDVERLMPDITPTSPGTFGDGVGGILKAALPDVGDLLLASVRVAVGMMAVVILCSMVTQMETKFSRSAVLLAGVLSLTLLIAANLHVMVDLGRETMEQLQSFTGLLLPVLATATAASGGVMAASAVYIGTVFVSNILITLINHFLIPVLYAYIAVSAANAVLGNQTLKRMRELGKWVLTNGLKLVVFLFTGYLGLSGVIAGTSDGTAVKAAKLALSSMVLVVGSMISDASETVLVSAQMLKNAAGVFGMLAVIAICLLPLLRLGIQHIVLKLTAALCSTVGDKTLVELIESLSNAMGYLVGMTGACAFMLLVSCVCSIRVTSV